MPDADPLGGDDPYEKLGVSEQMTVDRIKEARDDLVSDYKDEVRRAKQNDDNALYQDAQNALREIDEAWNWVQKNHEPPAIDKEVSISPESETPRVGETVTFSVTSKDGPESDVPVEVHKQTLDDKRTAADGTVEYTFDEAGPVRVTARTTPDHDDATTDVEVERRPVELVFDSAPGEVEVREPATFEVTDATGSAIESVELRTRGDSIGRTGPSGTETVTFENTGVVQVTATKTDDDRATYDDATTEVTITEETVPLNLEVRPSDVRAGDTVTVAVTEDDGTPVGGATVNVDGTVAGETKARGTVEVDLPLAAAVEVAADKSAEPDEDRVYESTTLQLSPDKRRAKLDVDVADREVMKGEDLALTVTDDEGNPVEGAQVSSSRGYSGQTDENGKDSFQLDDDGEVTVKATKSSSHTEYRPAEVTVDVEEFTRELRFDEIPDTATPGEEVAIRVTDQEGTPVENAEIRSSQQFESWYTDPDGWTPLSLKDDPGVVRITAEKGGDEDDDFSGETITDTIHVRE